MYPLNLEAFRATPLIQEPFPYLIVPGFVKAEARAAINADYPRIDNPGSFPVQELKYGPAFRGLIDALLSRPMRTAFEEKFGISLRKRGTMTTVRGRCSSKDGRIHTDQVTKLITVLIYMNPTWEQAGGCLRLLRSPTNLDDVIVEVPPTEGTMIAFRRSDNSYHGHKSFCGPRRVIQFNWVVNRRTARREIFKHRLSAWVKKVTGFFRPRVGSEAAEAYQADMM